MKQIFRLMIDDNDPRIMDEDEMMEDVYEKLNVLEYEISQLLDLFRNHDDSLNDEYIKF